jgi:hypothetical protein
VVVGSNHAKQLHFIIPMDKKDSDFRALVDLGVDVKKADLHLNFKYPSLNSRLNRTHLYKSKLTHNGNKSLSIHSCLVYQVGPCRHLMYCLGFSTSNVPCWCQKNLVDQHSKNRVW